MAQKKVNYPLVGVIMGSTSDWETMSEACEVLDELNVSYEKRVVSAHGTPEWMSAYATQAEERGLQIIIAGAGGAAHLPGMVAAQTLLPVIGVPVKSSTLICVIAAAPGYPGPPIKGLPISLPKNYTAEKQIFHAGTALQNEQLVTNGGRFFGISSQGTNIAEARQRAYSLMEGVSFKGKHFRRDIASKALN